VETPRYVEILRRAEIKHAPDVRNFRRMQSFHLKWFVGPTTAESPNDLYDFVRVFGIWS